MIKWFERNKFATILVLVLIVAEIFYFSSLTGSAKTIEIPFLAIGYHFIIFFLFAFFLALLIVGKKKMKSKFLILIFLLSLVQAILDEIHQIFVSFRNASFGDILTDSLGICFSIIIYYWIKKK